MAEQNIFEVLPVATEHDSNPYKALVAAEPDLSDGIIRFSPPFTPGDVLLQWARNEADLSLEHLVTTDEATVLNFGQDSDEDLDKRRQNVVATVRVIFTSLGYAADSELLVREYERLH